MRPTVRSRRLGRWLSHYRNEAGLSGTELAKRLDLHQASWSKIESGKSRIAPEILNNAVDMLDIPAEDAKQLEELRRKATEPGWWRAYDDILSEAVQMRIELETDASWIHTYESALIPGLLQTRNYAEQVITAGASHIRIADIDRYLELRMRRQKLIKEGLRLTAIIGEAGIRQQIGGPEVLREQLRHIAHTVHEYDVTVHIVPFTATAHGALGESFTIIQWPEETDPEAVYVDGITSCVVHEYRGTIRSYQHALSSVQSQALNPRESLDLISGLTRELT